MSKISTAIFDKMEKAVSSKVETASVEVATQNVLRQQLMERAGELQQVYFIAPGGFIPGFYSSNDRAFLPQFTVDK